MAAGQRPFHPSRGAPWPVEGAGSRYPDTAQGRLGCPSVGPSRVCWFSEPVAAAGRRPSIAQNSSASVFKTGQGRLHVQPEFLHTPAVHVAEVSVEIALVQIDRGDSGGAEIARHR